MRYKKQAERLLHSYNSKVAWGESVDTEAALQESIDFVFSTTSEEDRANLYAMLTEEWDSYQAGIPRRLFITSTIQKWQHSRIFGGEQ